MRKDNKIFEQMKLLKKTIEYMKEELIISENQARRIKKKITNWWFIKTEQMDKHRQTLNKIN